MTEQECLAKMIAPGTRRPGKYREGVIQIHVARACDKACFSCTQGSQLSGKPRFMSVENFELACKSLAGYFGVVGVFGGNPVTNPNFGELCYILRKHFPREQRGLWCNNLLTAENGEAARATFDPAVSNLNVHLDQLAYDNFKRWWPESQPVGLHRDSRHSPPYVAMRDVVTKTCPACDGNWSNTCSTCHNSHLVPDESAIWQLISSCDINQHWSAMIGEFRGKLRAWFCEIAGAQSILHQDEPDYPDTGLDPRYTWVSRPEGFRLCGAVGPDIIGGEHLYSWWQLPIVSFASQVSKHCFDCGVPLRGRGCDAQSPDGFEQVSETHQSIFKPKVAGRRTELVVLREQLGQPLGRVTSYLQNAGK